MKTVQIHMEGKAVLPWRGSLSEVPDPIVSLIAFFYEHAPNGTSVIPVRAVPKGHRESLDAATRFGFLRADSYSLPEDYMLPDTYNGKGEGVACKEVIALKLTDLGQAVMELRAKGRKTDKRAPVPKEEANLRAREALKARNAKWSVRKLAEVIGCSNGLISKLPAWRAYQEELVRTGKKKARGPKACSLTDGILAGEGQDDSELKRLIDEQQADDTAEKRQYRRRRKV